MVASRVAAQAAVAVVTGNTMPSLTNYFTDGSAVPNPGQGGFAVIKDGQPYLIGGEATGSPISSDQTTNIRMEARAIITALRDADGKPCRIVTDSQFWINVATKWAPGWQVKGWRKPGGEIKNLDLVTELYRLYQESRAELVWTRGHVGTELNELADHWANRARQLKLTDPVLAGNY